MWRTTRTAAGSCASSSSCTGTPSPPWGTATPLVAVTGYGQTDDRRRALDAGFDEHFTKPLDLVELDAMLARHAADAP